MSCSLTQAAELEAALAESTQQMSEAEATLKLKEMEFERRVTRLQKEHASKMATVLQQATAVVPAHRGGLQLTGVFRNATSKLVHRGQVISQLSCGAGIKQEQTSCQNSAAGEAGTAAEQEQGTELHKLLKLYKEEREQLSKDVLYYKQSCKDLKRRLKAEVQYGPSSREVGGEEAFLREAVQPGT